MGSELITAWPVLGTGDWSPARSGDDNEKVMSLISDSLTELNHDTLTIQPSLAESYEISDDGTTWTFKLKPDIPFHDDWGIVTAEDVKYTWGEWISEESNHGGGSQLLQAVDGDMDNFEIINDLEFTVTTTQPIVHLPQVLCSCINGLYIASKKYHDEMGDEAETSHPIGTGPWKFVSFTNGEEMVLEAFEDHWRQAPNFQRLVLKEIPDGAARLVQVQSGAVDLATLDAPLVGEAAAAGLQIRSIPDIGTVFVIMGGMYYPGVDYSLPQSQGVEPTLDEDAPWIQADSPEQGLAIREAMSLAIDREIILDRILHNEGTIVQAPLFQYMGNPELVDPSWTFPEYDPEAARQKLAEGGYPDGFPLTMFIYGGGEVDLPSIAEAIAGMWEEVGIEVNRMPSEEDILDERLDNADTEGLVWVKQAGFAAEPAETYGRYSVWKGRDYKFLVPVLEDDYVRIQQEPDLSERYAITRNTMAGLMDDMTIIPLYSVNMVFVAGPKVGEWDPVPGNNSMSRLDTVTPGN